MLAREGSVALWNDTVRAYHDIKAVRRGLRTIALPTETAPRLTNAQQEAIRPYMNQLDDARALELERIANAIMGGGVAVDGDFAAAVALTRMERYVEAVTKEVAPPPGTLAGPTTDHREPPRLRRQRKDLRFHRSELSDPMREVRMAATSSAAGSSAHHQRPRRGGAQEVRGPRQRPSAGTGRQGAAADVQPHPAPNRRDPRRSLRLGRVREQLRAITPLLSGRVQWAGRKPRTGYFDRRSPAKPRRWLLARRKRTPRYTV